MLSQKEIMANVPGSVEKLWPKFCSDPDLKKRWSALSEFWKTEYTHAHYNLLTQAVMISGPVGLSWLEILSDLDIVREHHPQRPSLLPLLDFVKYDFRELSFLISDNGDVERRRYIKWISDSEITFPTR